MAPAAKGAENGQTPSRKRAQKYVPQVGDLVFAKVRGHRFWPARVEAEAPNGRKPPAGKFPVFFFGTYESAVVVAKDMVPYESNVEKHGKGTRLKDFAIAMKEIAETPGIRGRPAADPHPGLVSETISEMRESGHQPVLDSEARGASDHSDGAAAGTGSEAEDSLPAVPAERPAAGRKRGPKKRARVQSGDSESKKKKQRQSSVSESDGRRTKHVHEAAAASSPAPQSGPTSESEQMTDIPEQEKTSDSEKLSDLERVEKLKAKAMEKERKKEELKAEKMLRKRQERLNLLKSQPVTVSMLRDVEAEIIESLSVEKRDAPRAIQALGRLDVMSVTAELLVSYPSILQTIRKCRKYVHDQQIRQKADYLHNKFKNQMCVDASLTPQLLQRIKDSRKKQGTSGQSSKSKPSADPAVELAAASDYAHSQSPIPAAAESVTTDKLPDAQLAPTEGQVDPGSGAAGASICAERRDAGEPAPDSRATGETRTGSVDAEDECMDRVSPVIADVVETITSAVVKAVAEVTQTPDTGSGYAA